MKFKDLIKLSPGDKVAVVSPSFAAPGKWPHVYELGLQRLKEIFHLEPVEYPTTRKIGASKEERASDLRAAFQDEDIKAVFASLGGNDQVTYVKNLPQDEFASNPKPFFGYSDNSHFENHLWLCGIPSFYGGSILTEFAMQGQMDDYTIEYLSYALFDSGRFELKASSEFNDIGLNWNDESLLNTRRRYQANDGWHWDAIGDAEGHTWGGCVESIDEMLRHSIALPSLDDFKEIIMFAETSEEIPSHDYVFRVFRALGERGILANIRGLVMGRPKAWEFDKQNTDEQKDIYKDKQRQTILEIVRKYNPSIPIVQNLDFGHTAPQIPLPMGKKMQIETGSKKIFVEF